MVEIALNVAMVLLALGLPVTLYRLVDGPTAGDRLLAVEITMLLALGLIAVFTVKWAPELFPAVVVLALIGVVSSVAVAKYLINGRPF